MKKVSGEERKKNAQRGPHRGGKTSIMPRGKETQGPMAIKASSKHRKKKLTPTERKTNPHYRHDPNMSPAPCVVPPEGKDKAKAFRLGKGLP